MEVDTAMTNPIPPPVQSHFQFKSDGLLLYVAQACYEPGTSPLSSWIPITAWLDEANPVGHRHHNENGGRGPLELFERYV